MAGGLEIGLSLLRGDTACPMMIDDFGKLSAIDLHMQTNPALSDRLAVAVLGMIASGNLPPGARLPAERRIAMAVPASRVCVRTALARLKSEGYIEAVQGSGTRVVPMNQNAKLDALIKANAENLEDLRGLIGFLDRCLIERLLTRSGPETLNEVSAAIMALPPPAHAQDVAEQETQLRVLIANATGNPVYRLVTEQLRRGMHCLFDHSHRMARGGLSDFVLSRRHALSAGICHADMEVAKAALSAAIAGVGHGSAVDADHPTHQDTILRGFAVAGHEELKRRIAREIVGMIATGRASEGGHLISERRLAQLFGVSRTSIRKALAALREEGVVASDERTGSRVMDMKSELATYAAADLDHLRTMARLRGYLEVWAASRAAARATEADLEDMRRILSEMGRSHLTPRRRIDLDMRLHLTITRAAGSAVHLYVTEILRDLMMAYFDVSLGVADFGPACDAMLLNHHTKIVTAITAGDVAAAARAMSEHVGAFSNRYEEIG